MASESNKIFDKLTLFLINRVCYFVRYAVTSTRAAIREGVSSEVKVRLIGIKQLHAEIYHEFR